jgi:hypothetical protein
MPTYVLQLLIMIEVKAELQPVRHKSFCNNLNRGRPYGSHGHTAKQAVGLLHRVPAA